MYSRLLYQILPVVCSWGWNPFSPATTSQQSVWLMARHSAKTGVVAVIGFSCLFVCLLFSGGSKTHPTKHSTLFYHTALGFIPGIIFNMHSQVQHQTVNKWKPIYKCINIKGTEHFSVQLYVNLRNNNSQASSVVIGRVCPPFCCRPDMSEQLLDGLLRVHTTLMIHHLQVDTGDYRMDCHDIWCRQSYHHQH